MAHGPNTKPGPNDGKIAHAKHSSGLFGIKALGEGSDNWTPKSIERKVNHLLLTKYGKWTSEELNWVLNLNDEGGNKLFSTSVGNKMYAHYGIDLYAQILYHVTLKKSKGSYDDLDRQLWKKYNQVLEVGGRRKDPVLKQYYQTLMDRGIALTETGNLLANSENIDKPGFEKVLASQADLYIKNNAKSKGISTFAYITPLMANGRQAGLKLMLRKPGQPASSDTLLADFKSDGGEVASEPSKHDKENWKTMESFEYFIKDPGSIDSYSGGSFKGNGKVMSAQNEAPIKTPLHEFRPAWIRAWGEVDEESNMMSIAKELDKAGGKTWLGSPIRLKAHYQQVDMVPNETQVNMAWNKLVEFMNDKTNPPAGHPCGVGDSIGKCAKKITAGSLATSQLAISHMQYSQVLYVALVFLQFQNLDKQNAQAIKTHDAKGKPLAKIKTPAEVFKKLKDTTKVQRDSNHTKAVEQLRKGKKKIVAPTLKKEEIEASQRANMQCALLMNLKYLSNQVFGNIVAGKGKRSNYRDVVRVRHGDKDQNQIINKILSQPGNAVEPFMNITPEIVSSMMPMIRLFKIGTKGGGLTETEFAFDTYAGQNPDRKVFTLDDVDRGDGVGIKEFSFSFHGGNPALSRKDIKAKLVMFFQSFQDFIKPRGGGKYRFVDLMLFGGQKPGKKAKKMGFGKYQVDQYDPSYYRIRADVGWSIRDDENFKDLVAARDFNTKDAKSALKRFNNALESINQSFFLNMVEHNIDIRKDGTVMVTAEYQAYIESATKTNVLDSLSTPALLNARDKLNRQVEGVLMTSCKSGKKKGPGMGAAGRDVLLNNAGTVEELYMESAYQSIMRRLIERKLIQIVYVEKKHIDTKKNPGRWESPPELLSQQRAAPIIASETKAKGRQKKKGKKSAEKNAKGKKGGSSVKGVFKLLPPDSKLVQLNYFYVSDLVDVILDSKKGISGEHRPEVAKTKVILGSFEHDNSVINIGAIPVSTQYFFEWFTDNVISKKLKSFPVMTFIRSLTNHLINDMLHEACITEKADASIEFRTTTAFGAGKNPPLSGHKSISKKIDNIKPLRSFLKGGEDSNSAWHYIIVYAMKTGRNKPHTGTGDAKADGKRGIHHLHIGRNRGIVKNITFEKTDIQYAREARYMRHGFDGLGQIGAVYNAKIEMIGNTIFYPGMLVYIDPIGIGGRGFDPTNIRSEANALGFGGYHLVTKADSSITPSGYKTTVTAMFNYSGESLYQVDNNGKRTKKDAEKSALLPERSDSCDRVISQLQDIITKWYQGKKPKGL